MPTEQDIYTTRELAVISKDVSKRGWDVDEEARKQIRERVFDMMMRSVTPKELAQLAKLLMEMVKMDQQHAEFLAKLSADKGQADRQAFFQMLHAYMETSKLPPDIKDKVIAELGTDAAQEFVIDFKG